MAKNKLLSPLLLIGFFVAVVIIGFVWIMLPGANKYSPQPKAALGLFADQSVSREYAITDKSKVISNPLPVPDKPIKQSVLKIIKTGEIRFRVKDYRKSRTVIEQIIKNHNAYIAAENEQNIYNSIENNMTIRIPAERFDRLVESLLKESISLDYKNIRASDVTAEFIDNETRLKTKREVEQRYLAILKRAQTIDDILAVENQLGQIREAIESTEGQLKYLNDQVNYSTITLVFYQTLNKLPQGENGFWYRIGEASVKGWNILLSIFIGFIYLWPFVIILGAAVFIYLKAKNRFKNV